jgi:hypothetical protein
MNSQAGKGDKPRNCFSKQFKDNYDEIKWSKTLDLTQIKAQTAKREAKNSQKSSSNSSYTMPN